MPKEKNKPLCTRALANGWKESSHSSDGRQGERKRERDSQDVGIQHNFAYDHYPSAGFRWLIRNSIDSSRADSALVGIIVGLTVSYKQGGRGRSKTIRTPTSLALLVLAADRGLSRTNRPGEYKDPPDGYTYSFLSVAFHPPRHFLPTVCYLAPRYSPLHSSSGQHLDELCFKLTFSRDNIVVSPGNAYRLPLCSINSSFPSAFLGETCPTTLV